MADVAESTESSRPPGWFTENGGRPLPVDASTPSGFRRRRIAGWVASISSLVIGTYLLLGPWTAASPFGGPYCGVPVMGRYDASSPPDLAATGFTACWHQAQNRRTAGIVSLVLAVGIPLIIFAVSLMKVRRGQRRRQG